MHRISTNNLFFIIYSIYPPIFTEISRTSCTALPYKFDRWLKEMVEYCSFPAAEAV